MRLFLLAGVLAIAAFAQDGRTYYVATNGSDTVGDGSAAKPWASIRRAAIGLPDSGGTVLVRPGVYTGPQPIRRRYTGLAIFRSEIPYRAELVANPVVFVDAANAELSGFEIHHPPGSLAPLVVQIARSTDIVLRDNIIHDSYSNDLLKINEESHRILVIGNVFYNQENEAGEHIDVNGCTDVVIRDNIFFNDFPGSGRANDQTTNSFVLIKNSGMVAESRRSEVVNNIFLNWQGGIGRNFILLGEDGFHFHETQEVLIENNLMIGNSPDRIRAPLGLKGVRDVVYRNNTVTGDLPSAAFAMRLNNEELNPPNQNVVIRNNIWSSPGGKMNVFSNGEPSESTRLTFENNLYWNNGAPLPQTMHVLNPSDDGARIVANPLLPLPIGVVLPRWKSAAFLSGTTGIRAEFDRLAAAYGVPGAGAAVVGKSLPGDTPAVDLLERLRPTAGATLGAVEAGGAPSTPPLRLLAIPRRTMGGRQSGLNQVMLGAPAGPGGVEVTLFTSRPDLVRLPASVTVPEGAVGATFAMETKAVAEPIDVILIAAADSWRADTQVQLRPLGLATINFGPPTVTGSVITDRNVVMLDGFAPEGGAEVRLETSPPNVLVLPATVRAAEGESHTEFFDAVTRIVPADATVTVTATLGSRSISETFRVTQTRFALRVQYSIGGRGLAEGNSVTLPFYAPAGGAVVRLRSSKPELLTVPETLTIPEGRNAGTFSYRTSAVTASTQVSVTADVGSLSQSQLITVEPIEVYGMTIPATISGGVNVQGALVMSSPPAEDLAITLTGGAGVRVPPTVTVPSQVWVAYFIVEADPVTEPRDGKVTATIDGRSISATFKIVPPRIVSVTGPENVTAGRGQVRVELSGAAGPGGMALRVESSEPAVLRIDPRFTVAAGTAIARVPFIVEDVPSARTVRVTVWLGETPETADMIVNPMTISSLDLAPPVIASGASSALHLVRIASAAGPSGIKLRLTSSNPELAPVPGEITVPAETDFVRFPIGKGYTPETVEVVITATALGGSSKSAVLRVGPPAVTDVALYPAEIVGGNGTEANSVFLAAPVPVPVTVNFTSSHPDIVIVQPSVTLQANTGSTRFGFATKAVTEPVEVTITGTTGTSSARGKVIVKPN